MWYDTFDAVFWLSTGSILGVILGFCFKSKCTEFSLCGSAGLVHIVRDVQAENAESQFEINHIERPTEEIV